MIAFDPSHHAARPVMTGLQLIAAVSLEFHDRWRFMERPLAAA